MRRLWILAVMALRLQAVVIQDVSTQGYVTSSGSYTGVSRILFNHIGQSGTYICSGALISDYYVLTAGHCVDQAANWSVTFQTATGTATLGVSASYLNPNYSPYGGALSNLSQYDIAVLQLNGAAPVSATRYGIKTDFTGITFGVTLLDLVGYGLGGSAATSIYGVGVRRHAVNVIAGIADSLDGVPTPDNPIIMQMSFSASTPGSFGLTNGGDSGGPMLFGNQVIGVTSFGDLPRTGSYATDVTYLTGHESLANALNAGFLDQFVPEPATWLLLSGGLGLLIWRRRARRPDVS